MVASLSDISVEYFFAITEKVSYSLKSQGLTVVGGRNGEGKTTLFVEAILWLLYGRSLEYGKTPGDKIRNRFHKNDAIVEGIIEKGAERYRVTRTRTKSSGTLLLKRWDGTDWATLEDTTDTLTQDKLTKLWGRDYQTFMNSGMFTSDVLRYPDFSDEEKKAVIDRLLGIESVSEAYDSTSAALTLAKEQQMFEGGTARSYRDSITDLERKLASEVAARDSFEDRVKSQRDELEERKKRYERVIEMAKDEETGIPFMEAGIIALKVGLDTLSGKRDACAEKVSKVDTMLATLREQVRGKQTIYKKEKRLKDAGQCPECGSDTDRYGDDLIRKAEEIASLTGSVTELEGIKGIGDEKLSGLTNRVKKTRIGIQTMESSLQTERDKLGTAETRLRELTTKLDETINNHVAAVSRINTQIIEVRVKLGEREEATEKLRKTVGDLTVIKAAFGNRGLRALLVESAIPIIEGYLAAVLETIGSDIVVTLSISGAGKLEINVDNPVGAASYHGSSAGQRRLVDLAILFAFLELQSASQGGYSPQVFFDEAFEKIDEGWQEAIGRFLRAIVERGSSIFMLSHSASRLEGMADQILTVKNSKIYQA